MGARASNRDLAGVFGPFVTVSSAYCLGATGHVDLLYRLIGDQPWALQCAVAAGATLVLSLSLTPLMRRLAYRLGVLAPVRERSVHRTPMPLLGGVAVYLAFLIGMLLFEPLRGSHLDPLSKAPLDASVLRQLPGILLGATVAVSMGVIDEFRTLRPGPHFLGQLLAAAVAMAGGLVPVQGISNPLSVPLLYEHPEKHKQILLWSQQDPHLFPYLTASGDPALGLLAAIIFTTLWIVGMMNTVNFLDGLDGLSPGVVAIAAILLAVWSSRVHQDVGDGVIVGGQLLVLPPLLLAAALVGFLPYNWSPARIFMGDSGPQFAGFTIGALAILGPAKIGTALLILVVPILDIAWVFIRRPASGRKFFTSDREHLHHRLLDLGLSQRRIVSFFYAVCLVLAGIDLVLSRFYKLLAFLLVATLTLLVLLRLATLAKRGHTPPVGMEPHPLPPGS